jgi:hypothetical protein
LRIKEQETRLTLHELDDDDNGGDDDVSQQYGDHARFFFGFWYEGCN